jgi:hypothetical protein
VRTHQLPASDLNAICAGPASPQAIEILKESQYSLRRLRLLALFDRISGMPEYASAMEILIEADSSRPELVAGVLNYPPVGVWLVRALRSDTELGYLNSLAAAVGDRAVPLAVRHQAEDGGIRLDVLIDTTDPYRQFAEPLPPQPLGEDEVATWRRLLDDAWQVLTRRHTAYAHELSAGLKMLAPIASGRKVAGASARPAFGGLALSIKDDPVQLAEVLVHELQHSKLNAVLDLFALVENDSGARWYAPWRTDPRPLVGVLHGIYAFASVVEFWHVERDHMTDPDERRAATFAFALRRHQIRAAIEGVRYASELTDLGRLLVDAADKRMAVCEQADVPTEILAEVKRTADNDLAQWQRAYGS